MALQISLSSPDGRDCPEAYARIREVSFSSPIYGKPMVRIEVQIFADVSARLALKQPVKTDIVTLVDKDESSSEEPVLDAKGIPVLDADGKVETTHVVHSEAVPVVTDLLSQIGKADPVALAYAGLKTIPGYDAGKDV